jgi:hypothetical protein
MTKGSSRCHGGGGIAGHLVCWVVIILTLSSCVGADDRHDNGRSLVEGHGFSRDGDPKTGKALFITKGCVICHSVNGVGGRAALPLDAPPDGIEVDPLVFAAAMWQGASAMLSLQLTELGYQIGVTGDELRDLAAFASDPTTQAGFTLNDVPEDMRPWIIDAPHWLDDDWPAPYDPSSDGLTSPFEDL